MKIYFNNKLQEFSETGLVEEAFVTNVVEQFNNLKAVEDSYEFWLINGYEETPLNLDLISNNSIIFVFDEKKNVYPEVVRRAKAVFQAFISESEKLAPNHYCFPLGYTKYFEQQKYIEVNERKYNVFFSGNLHFGRIDFYRWISGIRLPFFLQHRVQKFFKFEFDNKFPNSFIRFTSQFNSGLTPNIYSEMIANAKIVLCPGGIISVESFRLYEALMQGCIVISEPLPQRDLFKGCPIIEVSEWSEATVCIRELLSNPARMNELSRKSWEWYSATVCPMALARYMNEKIRKGSCVS